MSIRKRFSYKKTPEEMASHWFLRLSSPQCRESDQLEYEKWRNEDPSHAEASARVERSLAFTDRHRSHPLFLEMMNEVLEETKPKHPLRRLSIRTGWTRNSWAAIGAATAGVAVTVVVVTALIFTFYDQNTIETYETLTGERYTTTLSDGSQVTLNTNSRVEVDFTVQQRRITLVRGQALFDVVKNKNQPFVVRAENQGITALGTTFDVRLDSEMDAVRIVLIEGRVMVDEYLPDSDPSQQQPIPSKRVELTSGQRLIASASTPRIKERIDIETVTSWRNGKMIFREEPLAKAVREVNRYSTEKIRLVNDVRLEELRISGIFNTGSVDSFLFALESAHNLETQRVGTQEIVLMWKEE